jgi:diphosphomevalonate decarboxylase
MTCSGLIDIVKSILGKQYGNSPQNKYGEAFAPANIALCKYWGKRDTELNLPVTSSLSISLGDKGAQTRIALSNDDGDQIKLNGNIVAPDTEFARRIINFLNLFRNETNLYFVVDTKSNIPIEAGLASSAAGFAALIQALDQLFGWQLDKTQLSILARLGSGSACRSLWQGFVKWHAGTTQDGMDSFAESLSYTWDNLCVGLLTVSTKPKHISSREAMQRTVATSRYYKLWPDQVENDLRNLITAIKTHNFTLLGETAEANAIAMHALALTSNPAILYSTSTTITMIEKIWRRRASGLNIYFTQDAGPNLILLFLQQDVDKIKHEFPELEVIIL